VQVGKNLPLFKVKLAPFEPALDPRGRIQEGDADDFEALLGLADDALAKERADAADRRRHGDVAGGAQPKARADRFEDRRWKRDFHRHFNDFHTKS